MFSFDSSHINPFSDGNEQSFDYSPREEISWLTYVIPKPGRVLKEVDVLALTYPDWHRQYGGMVYGIPPGSTDYTFVFSSDAPSDFTICCIEIPLTKERDHLPWSKQYIDDSLTMLQRKAEGIEPILEIKSDTAESVLKKRRQLKEIYDTVQPRVTFTLNLGQSVSTNAIFEIMLTVGLEWGDGDLFHWQDDRFDESFFSVATSTKPGFFHPINKDKQVNDLLFYLDIFRQPNALEIYRQLHLFLY